MPASYSSDSPFHGGNYEPPRQSDQSNHQSNSAQSSDAYNIERMHGGFYEPHQTGGINHTSCDRSDGNVGSRMSQEERYRTGEESSRSSQNHSEVGQRLLDDRSLSQAAQSGTSDNYRDDSFIPLRQMPRRPIQPRLLTSSARHGQASAEPSSSDASSSKRRPDYSHRDALNRQFYGQKQYEQFLMPSSRRLVDLNVQCTYSVESSNVTWRRNAVRNKSPYMIRLAEWTLTRDYVDGKIQQSMPKALIRWLPGCLALTFTMLIPVRVAATPRNFGKYDAFPYMDWAYPYETKNAFEKRAELLDVSQQRVSSLPSSRQIEKTLEPQFLCFLNKNGFADLLELSVWRKRMGCQPDTRVEYVVVSFTTQQFNERNRPYLHQVGVHAARAAGVNAYWVSTSCLGRDKKERENNVWRICDIVRSAHSLVVAVSGSAATEVLMREWSMRVWTWPEILLSPGRGDIYIYRRDDSLDSLDNPIPWAKRNFAIIWDDAALSGQLLDHYEGSVILTPLELVTLALQCLSNRATIQYLEGDLSYSLMGLLRQRPAIVAKDNAFQAFARLSLANDSNMLLERLICLLPRSPNEPWHSLSDKWDASLWDIYPTTQVCGMGEHDTVIIDGVRGAAIRWNSFTPVFTLIRETMLRHIIRWILRTVPFLVLAGLLWVITAGAFQSRLLAAGLVKIGAVFMGLALTVMLSSPILIRAIYRGKVWDVQPWFFGVEGHMSLPDLELHIFGSYEGKLKWSAFGSPLSRHAAEKNKGFEHFCEGQDPSQYDEVKKRIDAVQSSDHGDRVFTLVDTHTMTVTLFSATRPPVAVLLCGREGGMQRALLCSYDWRTSSLYRETVLRMETRVSDKMQYMPRVRLGLRRKQKDGSF